jgi:hypothetical protein
MTVGKQNIIMPGLVPRIYVLISKCSKTWMAATSPAMTEIKSG